MVLIIPSSIIGGRAGQGEAAPRCERGRLPCKIQSLCWPRGHSHARWAERWAIINQGLKTATCFMRSQRRDEGSEGGEPARFWPRLKAPVCVLATRSPPS